MNKWICWYEVKEDLQGRKVYVPHCKCPECSEEVYPYIMRQSDTCPNCGALLRGDTLDQTRS